MGRLFLVEFEQPGPAYYMCKLCGTHIASKRERFGFQNVDGGQLLLIANAVNVQADEPIHHRKMAAHTVADVYCIKCGHKLGFKYVEVGKKGVGEALLRKDVAKLIKEKLTYSGDSSASSASTSSSASS